MTTKRTHILAVDDEPLILDGVRAYMEGRGYRVSTAGTGAEALNLLARESVALIFLDLMLPDMTGEDVCLTIRRASRVPIIMLTAKVAEEDIIRGLNAGADDYITKPFSLKELLARTEALLRRAAAESTPLALTNTWNDGALCADFAAGLFKKRGDEVRLTLTEQRIFAALTRYPNKVFTRDELIASAFNPDFDGFDRTVDAHIRNLRAKIEDDPRRPDYIITVHGVGYRFGGR
jgi:DNA-binding response OmpR family regulator